MPVARYITSRKLETSASTHFDDYAAIRTAVGWRCGDRRCSRKGVRAAPGRDALSAIF
jgi:hypothetical protein